MKVSPAIFTITVLSVTLLGATGSATQKAATPSDATSDSLLKAMASADTAALAPLVTGDQEQRAWVEAYSRQLAALRKLTDALTKRFGDLSHIEEGQALADRIRQSLDEELYEDLKRAKRHVDKDRVLLVVNEGQPDDLQPRLVLKDRKWKLDLASLSEYMSADDTPVYRAVADAAEKLSRDVKDGKFPSLREAAESVEDRLSAAEEHKREPSK